MGHLTTALVRHGAPEDDPADCGDEEDDRGDLEREQMVAEEKPADLGR